MFFVWEMMRPLLKGQALYVIPDHVLWDPASLLKVGPLVLLSPSLLAVFGGQRDPAQSDDPLSVCRAAGARRGSEEATA